MRQSHKPMQWANRCVELEVRINKAMYLKVSEPKLLICLKHTPILEWHVIRCVSKNTLTKDKWLIKIGVGA